MPGSQTGQADCDARTWNNEQHAALKPFAYLFCATLHSPLDESQEAGPVHEPHANELSCQNGWFNTGNF